MSTLMPSRTHVKAGRLGLLARGLVSLVILVLLGWLGARAAVRLTPPAGEVAASPSGAVVLAVAPSSPTAETSSAAVAGRGAAPCMEAERVEGARLPDGRIVLNLAGVRDLMELPGIGEKRARAILALRTRQSRFRSLRDLLRVRGLGLRSLRRLEPRVVIDPPEGTAAKDRTDPTPAPKVRGA
jgi:competence protein ComEA